MATYKVLVLATDEGVPDRNEVPKWTGSKWVPADPDYDFTLTIASFDDNETATQLIGSGVWRAFPGDVITFNATYNNGPPDSASIAITSDDGIYTPWGTDPLVMDSPYAQKATTENTNYPTEKDKYVRFTLTAIAGGDSPTDTETVYFRNYIYWGRKNKSSGFNEADIEGLDGGSSAISNDHTRGSMSITGLGAGEYIVFAYPKSYGTLNSGNDYEDDGASVFTYNGITVPMLDAPETVLNVTNTAGYGEDYYVYASTTANLGDHTLTSNTATINHIYCGPHTDTQIDDSGISELDDTADGESVISNSVARTYTDIEIDAGEYLWLCHPDRINDLATIKDGTTGFSIDGEYKNTITYTNANGYTENYRTWRSTNSGIYPTGENVVVT